MMKLLIGGFVFTALLFTCIGCTLFNKNKPDKIITEEIEFNGYERRVSYFIPEAVDASPSLVIVLHKSKSTGLKIRKLLRYRLDELAEKNKFIVLYPDGFDGNWNDFRKVPSDLAHVKNVDDTGFISLLIDRFIQSHNVNMNKVYVFGMSGGGHMAMRLATELPGKITAIAPTLAQIPATENLKPAGIKYSLPVVLLSGTKDPISPFNGGYISLFGIFLKQGKVLSVENSVDYFVSKNKISVKPVIEFFPENYQNQKIWIEKKVWSESGKPEIRNYIVHGGGHTLPGSSHLPLLIFGKTSDDLSIADEVVDFFIQQ